MSLRGRYLYNQRKLGKPQILCFGFLLVTPFHGFSIAFESAYRRVKHVEQKAFDGGVSHRGFPGCVDCGCPRKPLLPPLLSEVLPLVEFAPEPDILLNEVRWALEWGGSRPGMAAHDALPPSQQKMIAYSATKNRTALLHFARNSDHMYFDTSRKCDK